MTKQETGSLAVQDLQVKVAFLEDALVKLSDEYFEQQKDLQQLSFTVNALMSKLAESQVGESHDDVVVDERPPHY